MPLAWYHSLEVLQYFTEHQITLLIQDGEFRRVCSGIYNEVKAALLNHPTLPNYVPCIS